VAAYYKPAIVAVVVYVCALGFALCARFHQSIATFSSDETYVGMLYDHLIEHGDVRDFAMSNSPYIFPDLLVHGLALTIHGDRGIAQIGYGALLLSLVFACLVPWVKVPNDTNQTSLLPAFAVIFGAIAALSWQAFFADPMCVSGYRVDSFSLFFCPSHHAGAAAVGFLILLLVRHVVFIAQGIAPLALLSIFLLSSLTIASDALLLPWCVAPICTALLYFIRDPELRPKLIRVVGVLIVSVIVGVVISKILRNMAIPFDPGMVLTLTIENVLTQLSRLSDYYVEVAQLAPFYLLAHLGALISSWFLFQSESKETRLVVLVYLLTFVYSNLAILVGPVYVTARLFIAPDCFAIFLSGMGAFSLGLRLANGHVLRLVWPFLFVCVLFGLLLFRLGTAPLDPFRVGTRRDFLELIAALNENNLTTGVSHLYDAKRINYITGGKIRTTPLRCYQPFCPSTALIHRGAGAPQFIITRREGILGHPVDHVQADLLQQYFGKPSHNLEIGMYTVLGYEGNELFERVFKPKLARDRGDVIELFPIQMVFPDLTKSVHNAEEKVLEVDTEEGSRDLLVSVENMWLADGHYELTVDKEQHQGGDISVDVVGVKGAVTFLGATANLGPDADSYEFDFDGPYKNVTRIVLVLFSNGEVDAKIRKITIRKID